MIGILDLQWLEAFSASVVAAPTDCPPVAAHLPLRPNAFVLGIKCWSCESRCYHWREAVRQRFADGSEQPAYRFVCSLCGHSWICLRHLERGDSIYRFNPPKPGYDD